MKNFLFRSYAWPFVAVKLIVLSRTAKLCRPGGRFSRIQTKITFQDLTLSARGAGGGLRATPCPGSPLQFIQATCWLAILHHSRSSLDEAVAESGAGGGLWHALPRIPLPCIRTTCWLFFLLQNVNKSSLTPAMRQIGQRIRFFRYFIFEHGLVGHGQSLLYVTESA